MKRLFQRIKQAILNKSTTTSTIHPTITEELNKPVFIGNGYTPYIDEPSVFHMDPKMHSAIWVHWMSEKLHIPLSQAHDMAERHRKTLSCYPTTHVNCNVVPDILTTFTYRGREHVTLSMAWVMWYANTFDTTLHEAHVEGTFLTTRHPEGATQ